jgi:PBP1b-binding outer membrane lipoprotein LpoB
VHDLEPPMATMSPRRSDRLRIAMAVAIAMLMAGCASASEAGPTEPASKVGAGTTAPSEPAVGETVLHLRGDTG